MVKLPGDPGVLPDDTTAAGALDMSAGGPPQQPQPQQPAATAGATVGKTLPERYTDQITALRDQAAGMISSQPMRDMFIARVAPIVEKGIVDAQAHARALANNAAAAYVDQQGDNTINKAVATPDDGAAAGLIDAHNQLIDGLVGTGARTPTEGLAMKRQWLQKYGHADVLARIDRGDAPGALDDLEAARDAAAGVPRTGSYLTNRILRLEGTGSNPRSSATDAGQMIDETWLKLIRQKRPDLAQGKSDQEILALRGDDGLARAMTDANREDNVKYLTGHGVDPTPGAQYLAHVLGPAGAAAVVQSDPNASVQDALARAVGADKAAAMVAANPSILRGKLAGTVTDWADSRMGSGARHYELLDPLDRENLISHAQVAVRAKQVNDTAAFDQRYSDTRAQAFDPSSPSPGSPGAGPPLTQADFVGRFGAELGGQKYRDYQADLSVAARLPAVASMTPGQQQEFLDNIHPKDGEPGYATRLDLHDRVAAMVGTLAAARDKDPASYAVKYLPSARDAWSTLSAALNDPHVSDNDRRAAASDFARKTLLEQQRVGIGPDQQQILPTSSVERFKTAMTTASTSDDSKARVGLIGQIQAQKAMWGDYWPQVVKQLAPSMQPTVRAIAAGADTTAMTRLLSLDPKENPAALLKEQSETRSGDVRRALNTEMAPFLATLVGRQKDRDFFDYYNMADKLAALYVRDGEAASTAARDAFTALIGKNYDFRDSYRIPKEAGVSADDVQAGALVARSRLDALDVRAAVDDVGGLSDARGDSLTKFKRDGVWVTSPDNGGLNLAYDDKFVRGRDGAPLFLSWAELASLGGSAEARADAIKRATEFSSQTP